MAKMSAEQLAQRALDLDLVSEEQLRDVWAQTGTRNVSSAAFQQILLRRELLTNFQLERLLGNFRTGFFYGDYKVHYLVGSGTFARVYRAAHRKTNQLVAVKVLRRRWSDDPEQADRFYREGQLCQTLKHPNIVPIYDVFSQGMTHYIVMEFVEGRNLREFIKIRKVMDPLEATQLILGVASGLDYAFGKGISHRDLKLSNILISSRGQAKLVDFGLAGADTNLSDEALADLANPRTIDYAGLERATGVRKDDSRSDIFFTGCIYYHLLSGRPALVETRNPIQRLSKSRFRDIAPLTDVAPRVPAAAALVVKRAIEFDPERRYQTPGEMVAELKHVVARLAKAAPEAGEQSVRAVEFGARNEGVDPQGRPHTIMVVEGDVDMQDLFRKQLKRRGYRVLVTSDPKRALDRFSDEPNVADLIILSTGSIGEAALTAFNQLCKSADTKHIPAVLLLDERHRDWQQDAAADTRRVTMTMPIKLRQLRETLLKLLARDAT